MEKDFYKFYLSQHQDTICRRLHFFGTVMAIFSLIGIVVKQRFDLWFVPFIFGYFPAWVGHFFFEKNRPATFQYPLWSLRGDFRLFWEICTKKRGLHAAQDPEEAQSTP